VTRDTFLNLRANNAGGITVNGVLGVKYNVNSNSVMHVVVDGTGTGVIALDATNAYTGSTQVNAGTLVVGSAGSIHSTSDVRINGASAVFRYEGGTALTRTVAFGANGGAFFYNSGAKYTGGAGAISADTGDVLGGEGVMGNVTIAGGGVLRPGKMGNGSTGLLTVDSLVLQAGALTEFDISGAAAFDSIQSEGAMTLGGSLHLAFSGLLANDSRMSLFSAGDSSSLTGNFSGISATGAYEGDFVLEEGIYRMQSGGQALIFDPTVGELRVSAIPEPSTWMLLGVSALAILLRRGRQPA